MFCVPPCRSTLYPASYVCGFYTWCISQCLNSSVKQRHFWLSVKSRYKTATRFQSASAEKEKKRTQVWVFFQLGAIYSSWSWVMFAQLFKWTATEKCHSVIPAGMMNPKPLHDACKNASVSCRYPFTKVSI